MCTADEANRYYSPVRYPEKTLSEVAVLRSRPSREFIVIADFNHEVKASKRCRRKQHKLVLTP